MQRHRKEGGDSNKAEDEEANLETNNHLNTTTNSCSSSSNNKDEEKILSSCTTDGKTMSPQEQEQFKLQQQQQQSKQQEEEAKDNKSYSKTGALSTEALAVAANAASSTDNKSESKEEKLNVGVGVAHSPGARVVFAPNRDKTNTLIFWNNGKDKKPQDQEEELDLMEVVLARQEYFRQQDAAAAVASASASASAEEEAAAAAAAAATPTKAADVDSTEPPSFSRQQAASLVPSQPGAYARTPGGEAEYLTPLSASIPNSATTDAIAAGCSNNNAMVPDLEARLVLPEDDHMSSDALVQAEEVDPAEFQKRKAKLKEKRRKDLVKIAVGVLLLLVLVISVALAVSLSPSSSSSENPDLDEGVDSSMSSSNTNGTSPSNSNGISSTATTTTSTTLPFLPNYTLDSLKNGTTPQWSAHEWLLDHPELATMETWRKQQLFALATFYYAMDGPTLWPADMQDNWLLYDRSECYWFSSLFGFIDDDGNYQLDENTVASTSLLHEGIGYPCNDAGEFQTLAVFPLHLNESLTAHVPPELELLTALSALSLQENRINASLSSGFLPAQFFSAMTNLSFCKLFDNHLTGTVSPSMGKLSNLIHLDLGLNALTGNIPSELGALTSTTELHLYDNQFTGSIPSEFGRMTNMVEATLHRNSLSGPLPTTLGQWGQVKRFYLANNELSGTLPSELGLLTSLADFSLESNALQGSIPSHIAKMTSLQVLRLNNNTLTGSIPRELEQMVVTGSLGLLALQDNPGITGVVPEGLCVLGQSFLSFDCSTETDRGLCGCCWCPCDLVDSDTNSSNSNATISLEECSTDLSLNPLLAKNQWPGQFPEPVNRSNIVTINIFTDEWQIETSWTWSLLNESTGTWQELDSGNPPNSSTLHSYTQQVESDSYYRLTLFDSYGDGTCCAWGFGWFSVTNSTPSNDRNGTVLWSAVGDALDGGMGALNYIEDGTSLDMFLRVDANGRSQHVESVLDQ